MKVKPLAWERCPCGQLCAVTPWRSDFWIMRPIQGFGAGKYLATFTDYTRGFWQGVFDTEADAIAGCNAHHAGKIAALLEEGAE